jgi:hypothetical protein
MYGIKEIQAQNGVDDSLTCDSCSRTLIAFQVRDGKNVCHVCWG